MEVQGKSFKLMQQYLPVTVYASNIICCCRIFTSRCGTDHTNGDPNEPAEVLNVVGWCTRYVRYVFANCMYSL